MHFVANSQNLKVDGNFLIEHGQKWLWSRTLKLTVSQEWRDWINWFFRNLSKLKGDWKPFVLAWSKMGGQSGHRTLELTVSEEWTDKINGFFCMLIQIH